MTRTKAAPGVYLDARGRFWARPTIGHKRRTWRLLDSKKLEPAVKEAHASEFRGAKDRFEKLARLYLEADCPDRHFQERSVSFIDSEKKKVEMLIKFFGNYPLDEIRPKCCPMYKKWRVSKMCKDGLSGERTVDLDLVTLSNILTYGVVTDHIDVNVMKFNRPVYRKPENIRHSRKMAPTDGDVVHKIVRSMFGYSRSHTVGWMTLFAAMSGCRTGELLQLRVDAKSQDNPGYIEGNYLFLGRRLKHGVNPYVLITPELKDMLDHFLKWHRQHKPKGGKESVWFFPGQNRIDRIDTHAFGHGLKRVSKLLKLPHITPHGLRSFYVTKRRSDGIPDEQIASEIGDSNPEMISVSYGDRPPNWEGRAKLSFLPSNGEPVWKLKTAP